MAATESLTITSDERLNRPDEGPFAGAWTIGTAGVPVLAPAVHDALDRTSRWLLQAYAEVAVGLLHIRTRRSRIRAHRSLV